MKRYAEQLEFLFVLVQVSRAAAVKEPAPGAMTDRDPAGIVAGVPDALGWSHARTEAEWLTARKARSKKRIDGAGKAR